MRLKVSSLLSSWGQNLIDAINSFGPVYAEQLLWFQLGSPQVGGGIRLKLARTPEL